MVDALDSWSCSLGLSPGRGTKLYSWANWCTNIFVVVVQSILFWTIKYVNRLRLSLRPSTVPHASQAEKDCHWIITYSVLVWIFRELFSNFPSRPRLNLSVPDSNLIKFNLVSNNKSNSRPKTGSGRSRPQSARLFRHPRPQGYLFSPGRTNKFEFLSLIAEEWIRNEK